MPVAHDANPRVYARSRSARGIPAELRQRRQWVAYRVESRYGAASKPTKVPYVSPARRASTTDSTSWLSYAAASALARHKGFAGVGFVFSAGDPYVGVDLDGCRDPVTGEVAAWARQIVEHLASYTEVSPSGAGLHVIVRGTLPPRMRHRRPVDGLAGGRPAVVEVYDRARYFTMTGKVHGRTRAIRRSPRALSTLLSAHGLTARVPRSRTAVGAPTAETTSSLSDQQVLDVIAAAHPVEFHRLFVAGETRPNKSDSESDYALACLLAAHIGHDPERIAALMRQSALAREKWDRPDYLPRTVERALQQVTAAAVPAPARERRLYRLTEIASDPSLMQRPDALLPHIAWTGRVVLLGGREKHAGKSTLLAAGVAALTRGFEFLDGARGPRGRVLWVSADQEHTGDIARRFAMFDTDFRRVHVLFPPLGTIAARLAEIEGAVDECAPQLVVIDTLANLVQVKDPHAATEWPEALLRLKELARVRNVAVVVVHHSKKDDEEEYRDSTAIGATVDQIAMLVNNRRRPGSAPATRRVLRSYGRLGNSEAVVELVGDRYRVVGADETTASDVAARIREFVAATPGASRRQIIRHVGGKKSTVDTAVNALVGSGVLTNAGRDGRHAYEVSDPAAGTPRGDRFVLTAADRSTAAGEARLARWAARGSTR